MVSTRKTRFVQFVRVEVEREGDQIGGEKEEEMKGVEGYEGRLGFVSSTDL